MSNGEKRELLILKRKQSLMSQIAIASKIGMSQAQYSYIENGYADPDGDQADKLIEMLGLPDDYFAKEIAGDNGQPE